MRLKIKPVTQTFPLEQFTDENGEHVVVTVKQASTGALRQIADLFSSQKQRFSDEQDGTVLEVEREWNMLEVQRERAWHTLVDCNIVDADTDEILFPSEKNGGGLKMSRNKFYAAWDSLHPEVTSAIYGCIVRVNRQWDFVPVDPDAEPKDGEAKLEGEVSPAI